MSILRVGIIGVGGVAGYAHIPGLKTCANARITAICDIDPEHLQKTGDLLALDDAHRFTDYRDLIACPDVDAVEICTPNFLHVSMALDVVRAGKPLNMEKPLAMSAAQAQTLADALDARGAEAMMCFSYRFRPAVRYAKHLIGQGALGRVLGVSVEYLKDSGFWPGRGLEWRFIKEYAGSGVLCDLGVHLIDMTRFLVGDFQAVCGRLGVTIHERPRLDGSGMGPVDTDDECSFLAELTNGASATFHVSRCAWGHRNTIRFELYGTQGALSFNLDAPHTLGVACPALFPDQPAMHDVAVPDGYSDAQEQTFVDFAQGHHDDLFPSVHDGVACQKILDAVLRSAAEKRWVEVER